MNNMAEHITIKIDKDVYKKMPSKIKRMFIKSKNLACEEVLAGFPYTNCPWGKDKSKSKTKSIIHSSETKYIDNGLYQDSGSAARFFYCAKASKKERNFGLYGKWLASIEIICYIIDNSDNKENIIWQEKSIIQKEKEVQLLVDMEQSLKKAIGEYGIKNKSGIDLNIILYGKKILEKYLTDTKYITKMKIDSTTIQQILNLLPLYTTNEFIQDAYLKMMVGGSHVRNVGNSIILTITTNEKMGFRLGANSVVLKTQFIINEKEKENFHNTVKPLKLIEYLVKLITPKDGVVLDCFAGSGTTGIACRNLNRNFILIEKELEYIKLIEKRLNEPYQNSLINKE